MKKAAAAVLALAALGAGGYYGYRMLGGNSAPKYKTAAIERGDLTIAVTATGTLNAVTTVQVGSQVSGTLQKIYVDYNSRVRKGQPIAQLDPQLLEASAAQARANLENALSGVERAQVAVTDAERTLRRYKALVADGFIAEAEVDSVQTALDQAKAQARSARAQVDQTRAALKVAQTNLGYTTIHSPVDGTVISRNVDVGQTVAASFQTPTLFTIAQDLTKMQIDTSVDESDIARIKLGQEAGFTVDAYPDSPFSGVVYQVRNAPIVAQNVVTYDVVVRVDNKDLSLKPGMTANVTIPTQKFSDVLKIPAAALRYKPATVGKPEAQPAARTGARKGGQGPRVYVLGGDGTASPVSVKLGPGDGNFYQLVEGKLNEGDLLVTDEIRKKTNSTPSGGPPGMGMMR